LYWPFAERLSCATIPMNHVIVPRFLLDFGAGSSLFLNIVYAEFRCGEGKCWQRSQLLFSAVKSRSIRQSDRLLHCTLKVSAATSFWAEFCVQLRYGEGDLRLNGLLPCKSSWYMSPLSLFADFLYMHVENFSNMVGLNLIKPLDHARLKLAVLRSVNLITLWQDSHSTVSAYSKVCVFESLMKFTNLLEEYVREWSVVPREEFDLQKVDEDHGVVCCGVGWRSYRSRCAQQCGDCPPIRLWWGHK